MTDLPTPRLSVIILSFNGMRHLPECLSTIAAQSFRDFELIVVDNGSSDGSPDYLIANWPQARLITLETNEGFCSGMNRGVHEARGELVLLLNQDISLDPDCFRELIHTCDHPPEDLPYFIENGNSRPIIGVFPKITFYSLPRFINAFGVDWYETCHWRDSRVGLPDLGGFDQAETVFGSIFPAVMLYRQRFLAIGAFDPVFWSYCEDFDVCYRSNILGFRFVTSPGAVIRHKYRASSTDATDPFRARFWFTRNYLLVFLKNYEWKNLRRYGPGIFRRYLGNMIQHAIQNRNKPELMVGVHVIGSLMKKIPTILRNRKTIQANRVFSDERFWKKEKVEDYNIYHVEGCIVLSTKSMRAGKGQNHE